MLLWLNVPDCRFPLVVAQVEDTAEKDHTSDLSRFDMPNPDVGFHGVPNKEMVFIMPCTGSLVSLTETPVRDAPL